MLVENFEVGSGLVWKIIFNSHDISISSTSSFKFTPDETKLIFTNYYPVIGIIDPSDGSLLNTLQLKHFGPTNCYFPSQGMQTTNTHIYLNGRFRDNISYNYALMILKISLADFSLVFATLLDYRYTYPKKFEFMNSALYSIGYQTEYISPSNYYFGYIYKLDPSDGSMHYFI